MEKPDDFISHIITLPGIGYLSYEMNNHEYIKGIIPLPAESVEFRNAKLVVTKDDFTELLKSGSIAYFPNVFLEAINSGKLVGNNIEIPLTVKERTVGEKFKKFISPTNDDARISFEFNGQAICKAYFTKDMYYNDKSLQQCVIGSSLDTYKNPNRQEVRGYSCKYANGKPTEDKELFGFFKKNKRDESYYTTVELENKHPEGFIYETASLLYKNDKNVDTKATRMFCKEEMFNSFDRPANFSELSMNCNGVFGYCVSNDKFSKDVMEGFTKKKDTNAVIGADNNVYYDVAETGDEIVFQMKDDNKIYYHKVAPNVVERIPFEGLIIKQVRTTNVNVPPAPPYDKIDSMDVFFNDCKLRVNVPPSIVEVRANPTTAFEKQKYEEFVKYVQQMAKHVEHCDYSKLSCCTLTFNDNNTKLEYPYETQKLCSMEIDGKVQKDIDRKSLFNIAMESTYLNNKEAEISLSDFKQIFIGEDL